MVLALAFRLVRAWAGLYTWRLPPHERRARLAEIESDLWEFQHDRTQSAGVAAACHVLFRLLAGVPDDLRWRAEQATRGGTIPLAITGVAAAAAVLILGGIWTYNLLRPLELPATPPLATTPTRRVPPPPPPPPPPPRPSPSTLDRAAP